MNGRNDRNSRTIVGLIGGSLVLGALAGVPGAATAAPVSFAYLGSGAELRSQLLDLNQYGQAAKKPETAEADCVCPEDDKSEEGKCGEGKCGGEEMKACKCPEKKADVASGAKDKTADAAKHGEDKSEEGKCGEGKCG